MQIKIIERVTSKQVGSPYNDFATAYAERDRLQDEKLSQGFTLRQFRYGVTVD